MFEGLGEAIDGLEIPVDGDALAEVFALRDRLDARLAEAVAEFDRRELWECDGATSMTAWLRDRAGLTGRRASHVSTVARRLGSLPVTAAAWRAGELSGGQIEVIAAAVAGPLVEVFAGHETELVPALVGLSTTDTMRAMAVWKTHATADGIEPDEPDRARASVPHVDGSGALDGTLSPEGFAVLRTALRLAECPDGDGDPARTPAQRRHDALIDMARHFLDHQHTRRGGRHRPHLNVIVHVDDLEPAGVAPRSTAPS